MSVELSGWRLQGADSLRKRELASRFLSFGVESAESVCTLSYAKLGTKQKQMLRFDVTTKHTVANRKRLRSSDVKVGENGHQSVS